MKMYTLGHSTHEQSAFLEILKHYGIDLVVDVRSVPRSRHTPQFNSENFSSFLKERGISYTHLEKLGGLRHTTKQSANLGWRNKSFRGFADYMQTNEFENGIDELPKLAAGKTTVIVCAEALPWRCHRSLIGDALLVRGVEVIDIFDKNKTQEEKVTDFAKVIGKNITYPK